MKKRAWTVSAVFSLFVLLAAASVNAQSDRRIEANIPFGFIAGTETFPAGEYTFSRPNENSPHVLLIRSADNHAALFLIVEGAYTMKTPKETELVFNKIGDEYFLSKIWIVGEDTGREVPEPRAERELERNAAKHVASVITVHPDTQSQPAS